MPPQKSPDTIRAHITIAGKVQGVAYRACTLEVAQELGLAGWVRNLPDGRVEAVFEGTDDPVEDAIAWCQQGPPTALVKNVEVEYEEPEGLQGFQIR